MGTVALTKGGGWTFIGGWKYSWKRYGKYGLEVRFIFLRLSSPQNPCGKDPSGVCMDLRNNRYSTAAAQDAALKTPPAHIDTKPQKSGFPRRIGSVGQCFVKCKDIPWYMMAEMAQTNKETRESYSCKYAQSLGCKADGGKNTGYIDACKDSTRWPYLYQGCK